MIKIKNIKITSSKYFKYTVLRERLRDPKQLARKHGDGGGSAPATLMLPHPPLSNDSAYCVCLGTGRFLRAVLVPSLRAAGLSVVLAQPRGTDFLPYLMRGGMATATAEGEAYEVDEIARDGSTLTTYHRVSCVGSLSTPEGKGAFLSLPEKLGERLRLIGVGVTEAGIKTGSPAMALLTEFLFECMKAGISRCSVVNTDNVPRNGVAIRACVLTAASDAGQELSSEGDFEDWLLSSVTFHNSMVDRITSHRVGDPHVPRVEPLPLKALVIEDLKGVLPAGLLSCPGVVVRREPGKIDVDHALKLRIANATHTAIVQAMALCRIRDTRACAENPFIMHFLSRLYECDIRPGLVPSIAEAAEVDSVWRDWSSRLTHPHFGLGTFFITQNAYAKLRIRLVPSLSSLFASRKMPSQAMIVAVATLIRFLMPRSSSHAEMDGEEEGGIVTGSLFQHSLDEEPCGKETYASQLSVDYDAGTYKFLCSEGTAILAREYPNGSVEAIAHLLHSSGLAMDSAVERAFCNSVCHELGRMVRGEATSMDLVHEVGSPVDKFSLSEAEIGEAVVQEVETVEVIDLHTHLFPPSHGNLMLWGIDSMLTYHYLVAEYFVTVPPTEMTPDRFFSLDCQQRADLVWKRLFLDSLPVSEACRGLITTLSMLGLGHLVETRDLKAIRHWFARQNPEDYCERIFEQAGVKYAIMTNIPFSPDEAKHWLPTAKSYGMRFRSALRVDQLLLGDWATIERALLERSHPPTKDGLREYLRYWVSIMQPEYFMASTPRGFTPNDLLTEVLLPLAEELKLPLAIKVGAHRGINPALRDGGDGLEVANLGFLRDLLQQFPKVKFLATFLSRVNQHEATVLASKFSNLHLYGCWWYCFTPSMLEEITDMRTEILGSAFTAQHSDARVLDQLLYKWSHSREVIARVLTRHFQRLRASGWLVRRQEISQSVHSVFGGAYEAFMSKEL